MKRVVVALGGNALLRNGQNSGGTDERENLAIAADAVAALSVGRSLVVTHGNGPQVGLLALRAAAYGGDGPERLDVLGAETEGMIGYLLEREVRSRLPDVPIVTLLTQVEVDASDPAFEVPSKPIGPFYSREDAKKLRDEQGWTIVEFGRGWRRVVPSPNPLRLFQLEAVQLLLEAGHIVICGGGGGVPVVRDVQGDMHGIEGVVDKDLSAALLAEGIGADALLLLTDVDAIYEDWPDRAAPIQSITPAEIRALDLSSGSMGPKAEAAARFVERAGGWAGIGALDESIGVLTGTSGTRVEAL